MAAMAVEDVSDPAILSRSYGQTDKWPFNTGLVMKRGTNKAV